MPRPFAGSQFTCKGSVLAGFLVINLSFLRKQETRGPKTADVIKVKTAWIPVLAGTPMVPPDCVLDSELASLSQEVV